MARTRLRSHALALLAVGTTTIALSGCSLLGQFTGSGQAARDADGQLVEGNDSTDIFTLTVGDCLNDSTVSDEVDNVPTVPCGEAHDSEIYASIIMSETEFPGIEAITAEADSGCLEAFESFITTAYNDSKYDFSYYHPTEGSWSNGDREILCVVYDPSGQITGTLDGIGS